MKRVKVLFINMVLLTATSLLIRTIAVSYQVYLSNRIGSAGIGLYQLIMSVFTFALTFSVSGIRLATTRLVSEELGKNNHKGAKTAVRYCIYHALGFGFCAAVLLFSFSSLIGNYWLGDERTILSLRLLAVSLPFIAMTSVMNGYFTAVRRVAKCAVVQFTEQLIRISATVFCITFFMPDGLEYACAAIVIGADLAEASSFLILFLMFLWDKRRYRNNDGNVQGIGKRMFHISLPIACSSYVRSGLSTIEHLLIPRGLKQSGASTEAALTTYGLIHGMVMPIILFPSALMIVLSDLLVPEITECLARGNRIRLNYMVTRVFQMGMLFSIGVMGVMLCFAEELGIAIYHTSDASYFIRIFAPLVIVMYMDMLVDGMLKGLGAQISSMRYNIIDAFVGVIMVAVFVPKFAINGYVLTIVVTEFLNFCLSIRKLMKISDFTISFFTSVLKPIFCICSAIAITKLLFRFIILPFSSVYLTLAVHILSVIAIYIFYLYMFSCLTKEDTRWFTSIFRA